MKTGKRILSVFLVVLMLLTAAPLAGFVGLEVTPKAKALAETGPCGDNVYWDFDSPFGALTISGTGAMTDYSFLDSPFFDSTVIKTVIINSGVTSIGDYAFYACDSLTSVTISNSVKSIGRDAFAGCSSLKSVTIPNSVNSIGEWAFSNCSSMTSVTISNSVTKIERDTFSACNSLTSVTIPNSVKSIGQYAFCNCTAMKSISISRSVKTIDEYAFGGCDELESVYYKGSQTEWNQITIGSGNEWLTTATIHFNSSGEEPPSYIPVESIILNRFTTEIPLILEKGTSEKLFVTFIPSNATNKTVQWSSSDPTVATVNQDGVVVSLREGITFIEAKVQDNNAFHWTECKVIVRGNGNNSYSLGEETYSFQNYDYTSYESSCDHGGHCFGMSVTSSMFYLGLLDKYSITGFEDRALYDYGPSFLVTNPICHYHDIQGSTTLKAVVAGGNFQRSIFSKLFQNAYIERDWNETVNYVKHHSFDNKGNLYLSFWGKEAGEKTIKGHTINFLRYSFVEGEERLYVYDNNYPNYEAWFYKDSDGFVREIAVDKYGEIHQGCFDEAILGIGLFSVSEYSQVAQEYKRARTLYSNGDSIVVENADKSLMSGDSPESICRFMYEIPDNLTEVRIAPLTDHAEFTYMDQVYQIDREDENTIGILKLAESEDDTGTLTIINDPDNHVHIYNVDSFTEPTCTNAGEIICKCSRCGGTIMETVDALGHYDNNDDSICDDCGVSMLPHTHTYTSAVTTEPTCTKDGETIYTCDCSDAYTETIPALGHTDDNNDGHCDRCSEQMTGGDHCKFCGKIHNGGFFDKLTGFFHKIFAIFKR